MLAEVSPRVLLVAVAAERVEMIYSLASIVDTRMRLQEFHDLQRRDLRCSVMPAHSI